MKLAVKFSILFLCMFIFFLCLADLNAHTFRVNETVGISANSSFFAMKQWALPNSDIKAKEEIVKAVLNQVVLSKQSDCDIKVQILGIDTVNGLLDINIIQSYYHINGELEVIEQRQTMIIEEEL